MRGNIKVTPSRDETFALNLLDDGRAEFLLFDSITGESLKLEADVKTPEITPIVAGDGMNFISGDVISKNDMLSCEGLLCQLWNYNIDLNFSINSFALLLQRKGSDIDTIYSDGPLFNEAQRNAIRGIQNSQVIVIDQIRVYEPLKNSTELIKVPPVSLFLQF